MLFTTASIHLWLGMLLRQWKQIVIISYWFQIRNRKKNQYFLFSMWTVALFRFNKYCKIKMSHQLSCFNVWRLMVILSIEFVSWTAQSAWILVWLSSCYKWLKRRPHLLHVIQKLQRLHPKSVKKTLDDIALTETHFSHCMPNRWNEKSTLVTSPQ